MGTIQHIFTSPKADDADATLVRPSDWNSVHAYTMQDAVAAGTQTLTSGTLIFSDASGVTWGLNGVTLTASVKTNYLTTAALSGDTTKYGQAWELTGNTAGTTSSVQGTKWYFDGGNSLTVSGNSNTIRFSVGNYLTTAMASNRGTDFVQATAGFNGTNCSGTIASNSISISIGNYLTTADLSQNSSKYGQAWELTGNTAGTTSSIQGTKWYFDGGNSLTISGNSNTIRFSVGNYLTTAMASNAVTLSNIRVSAGATSNLLSALTFADSNGISFGINASTITATVKTDYLTSQSNQAASASNGSFTFQTVAFSNANNVTFGTSAGSIITASVAAPGAAAENNWINLSGNTAGNTTISGSTIGYSGMGAITFSGTQDSVFKISVPQTSSLVGTSGMSISTNGSTISVYPSPMSNFIWPDSPFGASTSLTLGGSSVYVEPFYLQWPISISYMRIPVSQGFGSTSQTTGGANASATFQVSHTYYMILFTQNIGASSRSLASYLSTTQTSCMAIFMSQTATNGQSVSHCFTYPVTGNSSVGFTTSQTPNNASIQISTTHLTAFTGARFLDIPFATVLTPGNYWIGLQLSSNTASTSSGQNYTNITAATMRNSFYAMSQVSANINEMGGNTTAGSNMWGGHGQGWWTTNTNGATTASMQMNQISTIANQPVVPFILMREA